MRQLLVLSGKGGTGKTTITSVLIELLHVKAYGDCDVDAPNLHLAVPEYGTKTKKPFFGMDIYKIDTTRCQDCGLCLLHCHFKAIDIVDGKYHINPLKCEGCGFCEALCPQKAISPIKNESGYTELAIDETRLFSMARLHSGQGNSGLLVSKVKKPIELWTSSDDLALLDGSPGIGCPVIASIRGVDYVLIVTEPNVSTMHDMRRLLKTIKHFAIPCAVVINKSDISLPMRDEIIRFCESEHLDVLGRIPYDPRVVSNQNARQTMLNIPSPYTSAIIAMSRNLVAWLETITN